MIPSSNYIKSVVVKPYICTFKAIKYTFKRTGARVDWVRKAKNQKVVLSCGTKEDLALIQDQVHKSKALRAEVPKANNPLIKIKDVLSCHTDAEMAEHLRVQNKHLFQDIKASDTTLKVRYRKKATNLHECHPIIELSPQLHRKFIEAEKVYLGLQRRPVEDQSPLVQCTKCLGFGLNKPSAGKRKTTAATVQETIPGRSAPAGWRENHPNAITAPKLKAQTPFSQTMHNASKMHFILVNLQRSKLATAELLQVARDKGVSIALVQEPYVGRNGTMKQSPGTKTIQCTLNRQKPVKAAYIFFGDDLEVKHDPQLVTETEAAVLRWRAT